MDCVCPVTRLPQQSTLVIIDLGHHLVCCFSSLPYKPAQFELDGLVCFLKL